MTTVDTPLVIWETERGRRIEVYPDRKVRMFVTGVSDAWPILWRHHVSMLTDEQWCAQPGPEWSHVLA